MARKQAGSASARKRRGPSADFSTRALKRRLRERERQCRSLTGRLKSERARLSLVLNSLGTGVVLTDRKGRVTFLSDEARSLLARAASGRGAPRGAGSFQVLVRKLKRCRGKGTLTLPLRRPDGGRPDLRALIAPLNDRDGAFRGSVVLLEDPLRTDLISRMSHELKTPLASIRAASDVIAQARIGALNKKQERMLQIITEETGNLICLIEDLFELSELESGKVALKFRRCSLPEVARSAMDHFRGRFRQKGVALHDSLPAACPTVQADPSRIRQVFDHLLWNALRFTPAGGRVEVAVRAQSPNGGPVGRRELIASVSDTGTGISGKELPRIFDRSEPPEAADPRPPGGIGFGLSLCRFLVEAHGGEIRVESKTGAGSTFTFVLPAERTTAGG